MVLFLSKAKQLFVSSTVASGIDLDTINELLLAQRYITRHFRENSWSDKVQHESRCSRPFTVVNTNGSVSQETTVK